MTDKEIAIKAFENLETWLYKYQPAIKMMGSNLKYNKLEFVLFREN